MKTLLSNPFEKYSGRYLLGIGLAAIGFGWLSGYYFHARYDGVFDLHFMESVNRYQPLLDILISIGTTALLLFVAGRFVNPKTRGIDILNTCLIAKIPFYILALFNLNNWVYNCTTQLMKGVQESVLRVPDSGTLLPILVFSLVTLAFLVLAIVLLFNGFKVAANAKGAKSAWLFVVALLVSEVLSKIFISLLNL